MSHGIGGRRQTNRARRSAFPGSSWATGWVRIPSPVPRPRRPGDMACSIQRRSPAAASARVITTPPYPRVRPSMPAGPPSISPPRPGRAAARTCRPGSPPPVLSTSAGSFEPSVRRRADHHAPGRVSSRGPTPKGCAPLASGFDAGRSPRPGHPHRLGKVIQTDLPEIERAGGDRWGEEPRRLGAHALPLLGPGAPTVDPCLELLARLALKFLQPLRGPPGPSSPEEHPPPRLACRQYRAPSGRLQPVSCAPRCARLLVHRRRRSG